MEAQILIGCERRARTNVRKNHYQLMENEDLVCSLSDFYADNFTEADPRIRLYAEVVAKTAQSQRLPECKIVNGKRYNPRTREFEKLDELSPLELDEFVQTIKKGGIAVAA